MRSSPVPAAVRASATSPLLAAGARLAGQRGRQSQADQQEGRQHHQRDLDPVTEAARRRDRYGGDRLTP
jgi:hypothetical protein